MVTSYYLHMMNLPSANTALKTATPFDIAGYYTNILDIAPRSSGKSLCRICLREGSIPIHGDRDVAEALAAFANVKTSESKDYPKHLCEVCHKFLKGAIMFRKRAKLTNKILKKSVSSTSNTVPMTDKKVRVEVKLERIDNNNYPDKISGTKKDYDSDTNNDQTISDEDTFDIRSPRNINNNRVTCKICSKSFNRRYYKMHLTLHNPDHVNQHVCNICGKSFRLNSTLHSHYLVHRSKDPSTESRNKKVPCSICNKPFHRKYIKMHMTTHNPHHVNEHICELCGMSFRLSSNLLTHHQRYHQPRKPETLSNFKFKCEHCPYRARERRKLKEHMVIHSGVKDHMCTECPAKFYYKCNLKKHMLTHKEPGVQCESCNKMFHTDTLMRKHYDAEHLGILKYVCKICGKAFGHRNPLRIHQRTVHKMEKSNYKVMPAYVRVQLENQNMSTEPSTSKLILS